MAADGGRFAKHTGIPRNQVWKDINGHVKLGSDLDSEKLFPKLAGTLNLKEGFGGFDLFQKQISQLTLYLDGLCVHLLLSGLRPIFL